MARLLFDWPTELKLKIASAIRAPRRHNENNQTTKQSCVCCTVNGQSSGGWRWRQRQRRRRRRDKDGAVASTIITPSNCDGNVYRKKARNNMCVTRASNGTLCTRLFKYFVVLLLPFFLLLLLLFSSRFMCVFVWSMFWYFVPFVFLHKENENKVILQWLSVCWARANGYLCIV